MLDARVLLEGTSIGSVQHTAELIAGRISQLHDAYDGPKNARVALHLPAMDSVCAKILRLVEQGIGKEIYLIADRSQLVGIFRKVFRDSLDSVYAELPVDHQTTDAEQLRNMLDQATIDTVEPNTGRYTKEHRYPAAFKNGSSLATVRPEALTPQTPLKPTVTAGCTFTDFSQTPQSVYDDVAAPASKSPTLLRADRLRSTDPFLIANGEVAPAFEKPVKVSMPPDFSCDSSTQHPSLVKTWTAIDLVVSLSPGLKDTLLMLNPEMAINTGSVISADLHPYCPTMNSGTWSHSSGISVAVGIDNLVKFPLNVSIIGVHSSSDHRPIEKLSGQLQLVAVCSVKLCFGERMACKHPEVTTLAEDFELLQKPLSECFVRTIPIYCIVAKEHHAIVCRALIAFLNKLFGEHSDYGIPASDDADAGAPTRLLQRGPQAAIAFAMWQSRLDNAQLAFDSVLDQLSEQERTRVSGSTRFTAKAIGGCSADEASAVVNHGLYVHALSSDPNLADYQSILTMKTLVGHPEYDAYFERNAVTEAARALVGVCKTATHAGNGLHLALNFTAKGHILKEDRKSSLSAWRLIRGTLSDAARALGDVAMNKLSSMGGVLCYNGQYLVHLREGARSKFGLRRDVVKGLLPAVLNVTNEDGVASIVQRVDLLSANNAATNHFKVFLERQKAIINPLSPVGCNGRRLCMPAGMESTFHARDIISAHQDSLRLMRSLVQYGAVQFSKGYFELAGIAASASLSLALSTTLAAGGRPCSSVSEYDLKGSEAIFNSRKRRAEAFGLVDCQLCDGEAAFIFANLSLYDAIVQGNFRSLDTSFRELLLNKGNGLRHFLTWGTVSFPLATIGSADQRAKSLRLRVRQYEISGEGPALSKVLGANFLLPQGIQKKIMFRVLTASQRSVVNYGSTDDNVFTLVRHISSVAHGARRNGMLSLHDGTHITTPLGLLALAQLAVLFSSMISVLASHSDKLAKNSDCLRVVVEDTAKLQPRMVTVILHDRILYQKSIFICDGFHDADLLCALGAAPFSSRKTSKSDLGSYVVNAATWGASLNSMGCEQVSITRADTNIAKAASTVLPAIVKIVLGLGKSVSLYQAVDPGPVRTSIGIVSDTLDGIHKYLKENTAHGTIVHCAIPFSIGEKKVLRGASFCIDTNYLPVTGTTDISATDLTTGKTITMPRRYFMPQTKFSVASSYWLYTISSYAGADIRKRLESHTACGELLSHLYCDLEANTIFIRRPVPSDIAEYLAYCNNEFTFVQRISDSRDLLIPTVFLRSAATGFGMRAKLQMEAVANNGLFITIREGNLRGIDYEMKLPPGTLVELACPFDILSADNVSVSVLNEEEISTGKFPVSCLVEGAPPTGVDENSPDTLNVYGRKALDTAVAHLADGAVALLSQRYDWTNLDVNDKNALVHDALRTKSSRRSKIFQVCKTGRGLLAQNTADSLLNLQADTPNSLLIYLVKYLQHSNNPLHTELIGKVTKDSVNRINNHLNSIAVLTFNILVRRGFVTDSAFSLLKDRKGENNRVYDIYTGFTSLFEPMSVQKFTTLSASDLVLKPPPGVTKKPSDLFRNDSFALGFYHKIESCIVNTFLKPYSNAKNLPETEKIIPPVNEEFVAFADDAHQTEDADSLPTPNDDSPPHPPSAVEEPSSFELHAKEEDNQLADLTHKLAAAPRSATGFVEPAAAAVATSPEGAAADFESAAIDSSGAFGASIHSDAAATAVVIAAMRDTAVDAESPVAASASTSTAEAAAANAGSDYVATDTVGDDAMLMDEQIKEDVKKIRDVVMHESEVIKRFRERLRQAHTGTTADTCLSSTRDDTLYSLSDMRVLVLSEAPKRLWLAAMNCLGIDDSDVALANFIPCILSSSLERNIFDNAFRIRWKNNNLMAACVGNGSEWLLVVNTNISVLPGSKEPKSDFARAAVNELLGFAADKWVIIESKFFYLSLMSINVIQSALKSGNCIRRHCHFRVKTKRKNGSDCLHEEEHPLVYATGSIVGVVTSQVAPDYVPKKNRTEGDSGIHKPVFRKRKENEDQATDINPQRKKTRRGKNHK